MPKMMIIKEWKCTRQVQKSKDPEKQTWAKANWFKKNHKNIPKPKQSKQEIMRAKAERKQKLKA